MLSVSALRHAGWWLEWQMRATPTSGCRGADEHASLAASLAEPGVAVSPRSSCAS